MSTASKGGAPPLPNRGLPPAVLIAGVLLIAAGLFYTGGFVMQLREIYKFSYFESGFLWRFAISSHTLLLAGILAIIGGIGLFTRSKWAWSLGIGISSFSLLYQIFWWLMSGASYSSLQAMSGFSTEIILLILLQILTFGFILIVLAGGGIRQLFQVEGMQVIAAAALPIFLIVDYVVCYNLLSPMLFG